ncbi:glycoside hydrolase family 3 protein [Balneolaceae bacterium YR4-1]|uniref:beta-N-acetylhexosaminidase n=1 Tax=Halalkalibaculum roseum TaxID=2709311 RepID=A0A6M1SWI5_9BACT|nr:glycoside hydrolase family 3 protein [Halalkalibaculum roseum]NGP77292.1 glycoside hydrolase family 3 protein [Halalkalibaculum roseum]
MKKSVHFSLLVIGVLFIFASCSQSQSSGITLDEKIGQMIKVGFRGLTVAEDNPIVQDIRKYHIGGVVLFDYDVPRDTAVRNISSADQVQELVQDLQSYADIPLIVAIDQEGGRVARLKPKYGFEKSVSAQYLGGLQNPDSTRKYARQTGETLSELGINTNLAPVVDVNINAENPVIGGIERSFSEDPEVVSRQARIYIETLHDYGIITTLKHFPGHGSSKEDSHLGVVDVTEYWQEEELIPYRNLIESETADIIMTAHIFNARLDSVYPATLSKPIITGILRDSLGFEGVVMSDDLQMKAIRTQYGLKETIKMSIQAGVDMLSFANNSIFDAEIVAKAHGIIKELVDEGEISEERIEESYERIISLKRKYLMVGE